MPILEFRFCPVCKRRLLKKRIEGRMRQVCLGCGWVRYENPFPVVVCAARNRSGRILIARRNLAPGKNKWALPGGFIESGESAESACLRELKEETGLTGSIKRFIGMYVQKIRHHGSFLVIGYEVRVLNDRISLNNELLEAGFFGKNDMPMIPFVSHRKILERIMS